MEPSDDVLITLIFEVLIMLGFIRLQFIF